jgi:rubrerythrin
MSIFFSADEIFEMAQRIEKNGARFYRQAAEDMEDSGARELLLELAAKEDEHGQFFAAMKADFSGHENAPIHFKPDEETSAYLRAWADGHVFDAGSDPVKSLTSQENMADIFKTAIALEKESIIFYLGFKDALTRAADQTKIDGIVKEEMKHIASLSTQLSALKSELT